MHCCFLKGCQDPFPPIGLTSTLCASFSNVPSLKVAHKGSSLHSQVPFHPSFTRYRLVPCSCWPTMQPLLPHLTAFSDAVMAVLLFKQKIPVNIYLHVSPSNTSSPWAHIQCVRQFRHPFQLCQFLMAVCHDEMLGISKGFVKLKTHWRSCLI